MTPYLDLDLYEVTAHRYRHEAMLHTIRSRVEMLLPDPIFCLAQYVWLLGSVDQFVSLKLSSITKPEQNRRDCKGASSPGYDRGWRKAAVGFQGLTRSSTGSRINGKSLCAPTFAGFAEIPARLLEGAIMATPCGISRLLSGSSNSM